MPLLEPIMKGLIEWIYEMVGYKRYYKYNSGTWLGNADCKYGISVHKSNDVRSRF